MAALEERVSLAIGRHSRRHPEERALGRLERVLEVAPATRRHRRRYTDWRREFQRLNLLLATAGSEEAARRDDGGLQAGLEYALLITACVGAEADAVKAKPLNGDRSSVAM